jgi:hypothetical protein
MQYHQDHWELERLRRAEQGARAKAMRSVAVIHARASAQNRAVPGQPPHMIDSSWIRLPSQSVYLVARTARTRNNSTVFTISVYAFPHQRHVAIDDLAPQKQIGGYHKEACRFPHHCCSGAHVPRLFLIKILG